MGNFFRRSNLKNSLNYVYLRMNWIILLFLLTTISQFLESKFAKFMLIPQAQQIEMEHMDRSIPTRIANSTNIFIPGNHTHDKKFIFHEGDSANAMGGIYFLPSALEHTNATWVDMEYVYVCAFGGCASADGRIYYPDEGSMLPRYAENGPVVGFFSDVVSIGSRWVSMYAHWVYDALAPILFIPQDVIDRSVFLLPVNSTIYIEAVETFGFKRERNQILFLNSSEWVFAQHFHTVYNPEPVHGCLVWGLKELRRKWRECFNETDAVGTDYAIYNRPEGNRHLADIDDWVFTCNMRFPQYRWILLEVLYPTFALSVKAYSHVKVLFAPTGSNFANMIFMNSGGAIVCALGDMSDQPVYAAAEVMNLWCVSVSVPNMRHHGGPYGILDYEITLVAMQRAIFAAENQRWPTKDELDSLLDD